MNTGYQKNKANIITGVMDAVSIMESVPQATIRSVLSRIGYQHSEYMTREQTAERLFQMICSDKERILAMMPEYMIDLLFEMWEKDSITMDEARWNLSEYLKLLGFALIKKGSRKKDWPNEIYIAQNMKDEFYFILKGKKSRKEMAFFLRWEKIVTGMMYYYGIIETGDLYRQFQKSASERVDYETFLFFLKCRMSFWAFGEFYTDNRNKSEYFSLVDIERPVSMLLFIREHPDIPYRKVSEEDLIYTCESGGLDNRWEGVSVISTWCVETQKMDYYRTAEILQELIRMIRNGSGSKEVKAHFIRTMPEDMQIPDSLLDAIGDLCRDVPLFEYKGYSRKQYMKKFQERELKREGRSFRIIEGGKPGQA